MAVPSLSDEQRAEALARAAQVRHERAEVLKGVRAGSIGVKEVFDKSDNPIYGRILARALIMCVPGIGKKRAEVFMEENVISSNRRVQGLGSRQREAVIGLFDSKFKA